MGAERHKVEQKTGPTRLELLLRLEGDFRKRLGAYTRDTFPGRRDSLSASSCGGQGDGHRNRATPEAADIE